MKTSRVVEARSRRGAFAWRVRIAGVVVSVLALAHSAPAGASCNASAHHWPPVETTTTCAGSFNPWSDLGLVATCSCAWHFANEAGQESADAASFGADSSNDLSSTLGLAFQGLGIEPMATARALATANASAPFTGERFRSYASAAGGAEHRVILRPGVDLTGSLGDLLGALNNIPVKVAYEIESSPPGSCGAHAHAWFSVSRCGSSYVIVGDETGPDGGSRSGTGSFDAQRSTEALTISYCIVASADAFGGDVPCSDSYGDYYTGEAQATADPLLYVDPAWEYAPFFAVQQASELHPSQWVEITRAWLLEPKIAIADSAVPDMDRRLPFADTAVASRSPWQTVTISNAGTAPLAVGEIQLGGADAGDFALDRNGGGKPCANPAPSLAIGQLCTVAVAFSPRTAGDRSALLTIASSDPYASILTVALSGKGVSGATNAPGATGSSGGGCSTARGGQASPAAGDTAVLAPLLLLAFALERARRGRAGRRGTNGDQGTREGGIPFAFTAVLVSPLSTSRTRRGLRSRRLPRLRPLVEHEPVRAQLPDGLGELLEADGLADEAVRAEPVAPGQVRLLAGGRAGPSGRGNSGATRARTDGRRAAEMAV